MQTSWAQLNEQAMSCTACALSRTRHHVVLGEGNPQARLMLIGEGPGENEDLQGRPFVGAAGQLLDRMLGAIHLSRSDVYICNVVKCRPPGNRVPSNEEQTACLNLLRQQFVLVNPAIILCLGNTAARAILGEGIYITRERGNWHLKKGVWVMPTYHPAALLRDASKKRDVWHDLQAVEGKMKAMGIFPVREEEADALRPK